MIENQINIFFVFVVNGLIIGVLFDFFRILRKSFLTKDVITYLQDIIFWILTGILILYSVFVFSNGEIRLFMVVALLLGITTYMLCISKYIININVKIILFFKRIFSKIIELLLIPINALKRLVTKIFIRPISFIVINIQRFSTNILEKFEKILKKSKKTTTLEGINKKM